MKPSQRLKISLSLIWLVLTTVSVAIFFVVFEDEEPVVLASYHVSPLDFSWREELMAKSNQSSYLYQLETGRYALRFYHFQDGEKVDQGYLVRNLRVEDMLEFFISSQVLGNRIQ